jgi:hypothetical protein
VSLLSNTIVQVIMVQLSSIVAALVIAFTASAVPLTVPLGASGKTLTVSDDGGSVSIDGQAINLSQAMDLCASCTGGGRGGGHQDSGFGKGNWNGSSSAAKNAKAVYFITNAANNSVVALSVAADGTLSDGSITATGGAGMNGIDSTGAPAAPDSLFSQGAVKVAGNVSVVFANMTTLITH